MTVKYPKCIMKSFRLFHSTFNFLYVEKIFEKKNQN